MPTPHSDPGDATFGQLLDAYLQAVREGTADWAARLPPPLRARLEGAAAAARGLEHLWHLAIPDAAGGSSDDSPVSDSPTHSPPLAVIGPYRPIREIGRGGFGVVYLAEDAARNQRVALKVPYLPILLAGSGRAQFLREAQTAAALSHPNIVPVFQAGEAEGVCYIASEYTPGPNLAEWLRCHAGPASATDAARLVAQVARAIAYTHSQGILHRDLKPANILLGRNVDLAGLSGAEPRVTDFGLACLASGPSDDSAAGAVMGTLEYMAPEQAARSADLGPACDVYALGAILYELLTGRPPFTGTSAFAIWPQLMNDEPARLRTLRPELQPDLEAVCLKCLRKRPAERYQSAGALADDLELFLSGRPTVARPAGPVRRALAWARQSRARTGLVVLAIAGMAVTAVGLGVHSHRLESVRKRLIEQARRADDREREVRPRLYAERIRHIAGLVVAGRRPAEVKPLLDDLRPRSGEQDLRGWEWHYLAACGYEGRSTLAGHDGDVYAVAFTPDGGAVATGGMDGTVRLWDPETGTGRVTFRAHDEAVTGLAFRPDGRVLATCGGDGTVRLWDVESHDRARIHLLPGSILQGHVGTVVDVTWARDGQTLISAGDDGTVRVWRPGGAVAEKAAEPKVIRTGGRSGVLAVSPDGRALAVGGAEPTVRLWDLSTGSERESVRLPARPLAVAFSADGGTLAAAHWNPVGRSADVQLYTSSAGDGNTWVPGLLIRGGRRPAERLAFSQSGQLLAAGLADGTTEVYEVDSGHLVASAAGQDGRVWDVAFAPDGRTLATASGDGTVRLWDTQKLLDAEPVFGLRAGQGAVTSVSFTPDGRQVAAATDVGWLSVREATGSRRVAARRDGTGPAMIAVGGPAGTVVASARVNHDRVCLWNLGDLTPRGEWSAGRPLNGLAASPDGWLLAACVGGGGLRIWDMAKARATDELNVADDLAAVAFDRAGGALVAPGRWSGVYVFDRARTPSVWQVPAGAVRCAALAPAGPGLATGGGDGLVQLWDRNSLARTRVLAAHRGAVLAAAYSPNGRRLVTGGEDGSVRVWDLATGDDLLTLSGRAGPVTCVAWSADGRTMASGTAGGERPPEIRLRRAAGE